MITGHADMTVLSQQRLKELCQVAGRVIVMEFGKKLFEGNPAEAMEDERVKEAKRSILDFLIKIKRVREIIHPEFITRISGI